MPFHFGAVPAISNQEDQGTEILTTYALGGVLFSPGLTDCKHGEQVVVLSGEISPSNLPLLADHVFAGSMLLPATMYFEVFMRTGEVILGKGRQVQNIKKKKPNFFFFFFCLFYKLTI